MRAFDALEWASLVRIDPSGACRLTREALEEFRN